MQFIRCNIFDVVLLLLYGNILRRIYIYEVNNKMLKDYLLHEYRDTSEYLAKLFRGGLSEFPPLIISCAITGANQGKEANINLPESAEEQAEQTYHAYKAGASIVHVHRRSSKNHAIMTQDPDEYKEVNALIREKCPDIIINNTAACGRVRQVTTPVSPLE